MKESLPSPPNLPPGNTTGGKLLFFLRRLADLQVASVLKHLSPWLKGRQGTLLEIGCGAQPYRHLVPATCSYEGLDSAGAKEHFAYQAPDTTYYDGPLFPLEDDQFENVFHTEVLEHIYDVQTFLGECRRILKPGGSMFFSVPFQARYHYIPHDFWRFTPAALERMLTEAGFINITIVPRGTDISVAGYKVASVVYRWLQTGIFGRLLGLAAAPLGVCALLIGQISLLLSWGSSEDTLGYVVTMSK